MASPHKGDRRRRFLDPEPAAATTPKAPTKKTTPKKKPTTKKKG